MAVHAPGDDPPVNAVDPGMWARLMGYVGGLNPIGSANAATAPQGPGPQPGGFQGPGTAAQSGGYPVNQAGQPQYAFPHIREALASGPGDTNTPAILPHLGGDGPNVQGRPILPYINPNTRELANAAAIPTTLPPAGAASAAPPYRPEDDPRPSPIYAPAMPPPRPAPTVAGAPAATIPPNAVGLAPSAAAPPAPSPWITSAFDRPNQNPGLGGGMMGGALAANQSGRGGGGPPQMGMLDLSHLFGGGQPAAQPAQPRTKIDVGKIPANARAEVPPVSSGPMDPSIIARQRMKRPKASSSSQGGGY